MHEMALSESVLERIEANARSDGFTRVVAVHLEIGDLAGVDADAMRFSFDAVTRGTLAEDARLEISSLPGEAWCLPCGHRIEIARRFDPCPDCGSHQLQVTGGTDLLLKSLEVM
jgi:hydrogenase nickel incorporation protein HypA/HybF